MWHPRGAARAILVPIPTPDPPRKGEGNARQTGRSVLGPAIGAVLGLLASPGVRPANAQVLAQALDGPSRPDLLAPADPRLGLRAPGYVPVTAGVRRFGVVEPKDWRDLNRAVGPGGEPAGRPARRAR